MGDPAGQTSNTTAGASKPQAAQSENDSASAGNPSEAAPQTGGPAEPGREQSAASMSVEDLTRAIDDNQKKIDDLRARLQQKWTAGTAVSLAFSWLSSFCSSGIFFLLLGGGFLYVAQHNMATNHAGITFILVVLGVAMMLYGTGTQGMGQFKSESAATYNVAIAGGAGVIAFIVAYGIIIYSPKMREAFQPERKFVRVLIQSDDGSTRLPQYVSSFEIDGVPIPSARRGNLIEVYVPFVAYEVPGNQPANDGERTIVVRTDDDKGICTSAENQQALAHMSAKAVTKTISAMFYRVDPGGHNEVLAESLPSVFHVKLDQSVFRSTEAGSDYPVYPVRMCVNLQSKDKIRGIIANAVGQELQSASGTEKPNPRPQAILQAQ